MLFGDGLRTTARISERTASMDLVGFGSPGHGS
jgi:hypothetical protein